MDKAKKSYGSYVAINICNYHTIEFRLFRRTLKYNTLIATLELVNKICELAVLMNDDGISKISWSEFVAGIKEPELIQYLFTSTKKLKQRKNFNYVCIIRLA